MTRFQFTTTDVNRGTTHVSVHSTFADMAEAKAYAEKHRRGEARLGRVVRVVVRDLSERLTEVDMDNLVDSSEHGREQLRNALEAATGERADKRFSSAKLKTLLVAAYAAEDERHRLDAEREAEAAREQAAREQRAEERKDFDAWSTMSRAARNDDKEDYQLGVAMRWAYNEVDGWEKRLAEHTEKLAESPVYALGWAGDFMQTAADYEVARYVVEVFEAGASFADMEDLALRELFNKSDRAFSRSTSAMSNLMDDATRVAWTSFAKRITGRAFW